jgi:hypothetical protein
MNRCVRLAAVAGLAAGSVPVIPVIAGPVEVIYCKRGGDPKASVAGWLDLGGAAQAVEVKAINTIALSPDGSRWVLRVQTTAAATNDVGAVYGTGVSGSVLSVGGTAFVEGQPSPAGSGTSAFMDFITTTGFAGWDSGNRMVLGTRWRTTQTGATTSSDGFRCFLFNASLASMELVFRATDPYTGLQGGTGTGPIVGTSITNVHLLDDGRVGAHDTNALNISSSNRPVASYTTTPRTEPPAVVGFQQTNGVPAGQAQILDSDGVTPLTWNAIDTDFHTTPSGQHWYLHGRVTSSTGPLVFVTDGRVRLKSTEPIGASGITPTSFLQVVMTGTGDWYVRGAYSGGQYIAKNGVVIAHTGDPVTPGSADTWGATFSAVAANDLGDYVLLGPTSAAAETSDVAVLNGTQVVLREGDPVDVDGNGQFDDAAWIGRGNTALSAFAANNWALGNNRVLYGVAMLRDGAAGGNDINTTVTPAFGVPDAFVRVALGAPCYANCDGSTAAPVLNVQDFSCFLTRYASGDAYANCDGSTATPVLNVQDFSCFLTKYAGGCP